MFPQYLECGGGNDYVSAWKTNQEASVESPRSGNSEWQRLVGDTPSSVEFVVFQIASVILAEVVGVAFHPWPSLLQMLGFACIEYEFIVITLRVVKYARQRSQGSIACKGMAVDSHRRARQWGLLMLRSAPLGLFYGIIAHRVHPFMAQIGAVYIGLVIAADVVLLWRRFVTQI